MNYYAKHLVLILLCLLIYQNDGFAAKTMNGISINDYKGFESTWNFVTVRFRKDTGEMRFTYANPTAWATMKAGKSEYPDGSVFAKVSVRTQIDPTFPSSKVPSGKRRVQFMVRNQSRYKETYGWGYALFSPNGTPFDGNHKAKSMACAACHYIVKDQGQVFSKPISFKTTIGTGTDWRSRIIFKTTAVSEIPEAVRKRLPKTAKKIDLVQGELTSHLFYGTLDEVRPVLIEKAMEVKRPTALISVDKKQFSVVYPAPNGACKTKKMNKSSNPKDYFKAFHSVPNKKQPILEMDICE